MDAPKLVVRAVDAGTRPVRLRLPFRFGAHTVTECPQVFVRVDVDVEGRGRARGWAAEMMMPKWFDKRPGRAPADDVADLGASVLDAARRYLGDAPRTAFGLFEAHHRDAVREQRAGGRADLVAGYGAAVVDRAVVDALCRALDRSFFDVARANGFGLRASPLFADLDGWDWDRWLATLAPLDRIEARHTVGLLDEIEAVKRGADGLADSLPAAIADHGHRSFKLKLGGDPAADLARVAATLAVLARLAPGFRYTLDGNEQYADRAALAALLDGLRALPVQPAYVEQPLPRDASFEPLPVNAPPFLMDEADGTIDAFRRGREHGWRGVSSKGCKGLWKAVVNRARCDRWNAEGACARWFMSAEDLTCQAGVSVQQDLAIAALLGLSDAERNGHHYADGFGAAPAAEGTAFAAAHPDVYETASGRPRLRIERGVIAIGSLAGPGFAHAADPVFDGLEPLTA